MYSYLTDQELLEALATLTQVTQYVAITALDRNENELQRLEGFATGGTVNINGSSSVRRTASLQMIAIPKHMQGYEEYSNIEITNIKNVFSINTRVRLEVGIKNPKGAAPFSNYTTDVFWFPLGIYILTAANISHNAQGISLSLNLKDKMVLLNGECGGTFSNDVTHAPLWVENVIVKDGKTKLEGHAEQVKIRPLLHTLLTEYGKIPTSNIVISDIDNRIKQIVRWAPSSGEVSLYGQKDTTTSNNSYIFTLKEPADADKDKWREFKFNDSVGFQYTDFVYPIEGGKAELASSAGEAITSVLDKVRNVLGNFEYFFDVYGVFHMQEKRNFINEGSNLDDLGAALHEKYFFNTTTSTAVFNFNDKNLATAYTNAPQYGRIKNDITIRGKKDKQLLQYRVILDNPVVPTGENFYVKYERRIMSETEDAIVYQKRVDGQDAYRAVSATASDTGVITISSKNIYDYRTYVYYKAVKGEYIEPYSKDILEWWPLVYDIKQSKGAPNANGIDPNLLLTANNGDAATWYLDIVNPETASGEDKKINFPYLVSKVGYRPTVIKDDSINCLYGLEPWDVVLIPAGTTDTEARRTEAIEQGMSHIQISDKGIGENLVQSLATNPAYDALRAAIHDYMSYNETITIQSVPIYWLDVNQRIYVKDEDADIDGDFMINSISIPLAPNGTMNINAVRAVERV